MKWGVRRYQNKDGTLTPAGKRQIAKQEQKWIKKNHKKITRSAERAVAPEMGEYQKKIKKEGLHIRNKTGELSAYTINLYNRKMASLMTEKTTGISSPSGKTVQFVAKRSSTGVYMALADQGYNMSQLKNGIYGSGRVAYKKQSVDRVSVD